MSEMLPVFGRRVRQARTIRSSPIKPLAARLDLTPKAWSVLERSVTTPLPALKVRALATALRFPMRFFQSPPSQSVVHRGSLLLRAKKTISVAELQALTSFTEMTEELFAALSEHATAPPLRLPTWLRAGTGPEKAAQLVREAVDLPADQPLGHVMHTVERAGVLVVVADVGLRDARHDAFSVWVGDFQEEPVVVARPVNSWERTRWSVAHEVGHLVLHRGLPRTEDDGDVEQEADRFANEFLFPGDMLRKEWPRVATLTTLMPLKQRWQMSLASLIMHGRAHGLVDRDRVEGLFKQLSARRDPHTGVTWRVQEPGWDQQAPERPRLLAVMTERGMGVKPTPDLYSDISGGWAPDLMVSIVAGQRPAPAVSRALPREPQDGTLSAKVIPFAKRG